MTIVEAMKELAGEYNMQLHGFNMDYKKATFKMTIIANKKMFDIEVPVADITEVTREIDMVKDAIRHEIRACVELKPSLRKWFKDV